MIRKFKKKVRDYFSHEQKIKEEILVNHYLNKCLSSDDSLIEHKENNNVIVSLTTYSHRIEEVYLAIESIGHQTVKPNAIVLWLDEDEFSLDSLPETLKKQMRRGLDVRFTNNTGSYKKLFPSIRHFPEQHIITIDDDILYSYDMIERLLRAHDKYPDSLIGCRAHEIIRDNKTGLAKPYREWLNEVDADTKLDTFITTGGGTLFPAGERRNIFNDPENALKFCPNADDIWINYIARLNNLNIVKLEMNTSYRNKFTFLTQKSGEGLKHQNVGDGKNDIYLDNLKAEYGMAL